MIDAYSDSASSRVLKHSLTNFDGQDGCQQVSLGFFITIVPSVREESAQIIDTLFRTKMTNFVGGSKPNGALF